MERQVSFSSPHQQTRRKSSAAVPDPLSASTTISSLSPQQTSFTRGKQQPRSGSVISFGTSASRRESTAHQEGSGSFAGGALVASGDGDGGSSQSSFHDGTSGYGGRSEKSYAQQFPMLFSGKKAIDDAFVHEMHLVMRGTAMLPVMAFIEWVEVPRYNTVFNISDQPVSLLGGMLYASDEFLFSERGFVQTLVKDVKFHDMTGGGKDPLAGLLGQDALGQDAFGHATFGNLGGLVTSPSARAPPISPHSTTDDSEESSLRLGDTATIHYLQSPPSATRSQPLADSGGGAAAIRYSPKHATNGGFQAPSLAPSSIGVDEGEGTGAVKVTYRLTEYISVSGDWIVQSLQNVGAQGPKGKFFTRAFLVDSGGGIGSPRQSNPNGSNAPLTKKESMRNPVYGEDKLRLKNPKLLRWCLEHDPFELGNAATLIKDLLHYHKYSWTVLRLVRSLMKAIRVLQRFCRRVVRSQRLALRKVMREWICRETQKQARLQSYVAVPGDDVDAVVKAALCKHYSLSEEEKFRFIQEQWRLRRAQYKAHLQDTHDPKPYSWFIDVGVVILAAETSLFHRLTMGDQSVFQHSKVQNLMVETADQRKTRRSLETSLGALERGKAEE